MGLAHRAERPHPDELAARKADSDTFVTMRPYAGVSREDGYMAKRRIAIEFEGGVVEARALARAIQFVFEASSAGHGEVFIEGFSMNKNDNWHPGDPRIAITVK